MPFLTEEQSEEAEGTSKPTAVAGDDEKDPSERDISEGKNSSKDPGKTLDSLTFHSLTSIHSLQSTFPPPTPCKAY